MKNKGYVVFGVVSVIVVAFMMLFSTSENTKLSGVDFVEKLNITTNAVLVDVRTPSEFASGHIANAVNIDFEAPSFASEIKKLDTSKTYFVYCRSGNRSGQAVSVMKANGIGTIYELNGGLVSNANTIQLVTTNSSGF